MPLILTFPARDGKLIYVCINFTHLQVFAGADSWLAQSKYKLNINLESVPIKYIILICPDTYKTHLKIKICLTNLVPLNEASDFFYSRYEI